MLRSLKTPENRRSGCRDWLCHHREHHYTCKENGAWRSDGENYTRTVHDPAEEGPSHNTSGTNSSLLELEYNSDALPKSEVLYEEVNDNATLSGAAITYDMEELVDGDWETLQYDRDSRTRSLQDDFLRVSWGGYIPEPTDAQPQKQLDDFRAEWNALAPNQPLDVSQRKGALRLDAKISSAEERLVCNKAVKLWSEFGFARVPGDSSAGLDELQQPGDRPPTLTSFKYTAREAGYNGGIVTMVPENEKERIDYPEPKSYEDHDFMRFGLSEIPWSNFRITKRPL